MMAIGKEIKDPYYSEEEMAVECNKTSNSWKDIAVKSAKYRFEKVMRALKKKSEGGQRH